MSDCLEKGIYSTHQIQAVAVDKDFTQQQQQYDERIENYQQLCQKLQNYSDLINGFITKILAQINRQIDKLQNEFSNIPQQQDQVMKENPLIVTQKEELLQVLIFMESERDFLLLIQEQIQKQSFEQQNLEIIVQIQKLLKIQKSEENASTIIDKDNQTKKTLSLECLPDVKVQLPRLIKQIINTLIYPLRYFQYPIKQGSIFYSNHQRQMPLKFSTTLKHSIFTISADGKTAECSDPNNWYLCLCDQPITKNTTVVVDFKVKQIEYIMAGICLKDSYNKDYTNSYGNGKGCYFLYTTGNNGYVYSHHDPNKNGHFQGFPFYQNDIISMEVNVQSKLIIWRNKAKNHVYTLDIQTTSDFENEIELV